jgi:SAM-dependent methyltransferase
MTSEFEDLLHSVDRYYTAKLRDHGPTPQGVDWNSRESQCLRFEQLLKLCQPGTAFSINDYGCGYGALVDYMASKDYAFSYRGVDVSEEMVLRARQLHATVPKCDFVWREVDLREADFSVASGIFNVKLNVSSEQWTRYVLDTLDRLDRISLAGFGFNMLTSYSDPNRMRPDLYYGDPCFFFDYCKKKYSLQVALLHDYGLYEFTILVRKHLPESPLRPGLAQEVV